ncbi:MAG TPA: hypothetical protein VFE60_21605 [Roseiarcus sp.]|jgi:hypothetical protein|nr:hypothetical protein [Roseiarcus sp.]
MDNRDCLAHYPFVVVRIACRVCARRGSYVPADHLAQFVVALAREHLDLSEIVASYKSGLGQPPFDPRMMTALTPHFSDNSTSCRADRPSDPTPNDTQPVRELVQRIVLSMLRPEFDALAAACEARRAHKSIVSKLLEFEAELVCGLRG